LINELSSEWTHALLGHFLNNDQDKRDGKDDYRTLHRMTVKTEESASTIAGQDTFSLAVPPFPSQPCGHPVKWGALRDSHIILVKLYKVFLSLLCRTLLVKRSRYE
jgi:hypothetical protein